MPEYPYNFAGQLEEILKELSKIQTPWSKALQGMLKQQKAQASTENVTGQQPASPEKPISDKGYDDFWVWMKDQYGRGQWNYAFAGADITPYHDYWAQYIWSQTHKEAAPAVSNVTPEPFPDLAGATTSAKPKMPETFTLANGETIPVNYTAIDQVRIDATTTLEIDGQVFEVKDPSGATKVVTYYAPVIPVDQLTPENIKAIYKNIYGMTDTGELYNGGKAFSPQDLQGIIPYDPLTGEADLSQLSEMVAYPALKQYAQEKLGQVPNEQMDAFLQQEAALIGKGTPSGTDFIDSELGKLAAGQQVKQPAPRQPLTPAEDAAKAQAMTGIFKGNNQQAPTEIQDIQAQMAQLKPTYDQYRQLIDSGQVDPKVGGSSTDQMGVLAVTRYEQLQKRLAEIQGGALPRIGKVGQFEPASSQRLAEIAKELGVPYEQIAALGQNYLGNSQNPEFGNLQPVEKTKLIEAGRIVQNQSPEGTDPLEEAQKLKATEEAAYQALLKKARQQPNQPQRLARL